ncbi:class I SAM-dependent methyltransferase [Aldersonia sp. NBC_00410]|uniref:class I SAM-dependent methyltransferase n=1 Tax=Aldersonia sp. NBC_00410 TaxID=2975954 RepID=UPI00224E7051|nr:class I SAM-dependent methyltransferase [Aldersonia sp. NBC_00410]MCX5046219.1 class I SAM-dependent methyltransferase [Aldersonia sp. NBC_00410]
MENRAQDRDGAVLATIRELCDWAGRDVVDVGCGSGFHLPQFAQTARSVTGVEPHPPLTRAAAHRVRDLPTVQVLRGAGERLPLPDAAADLVHARTAYFFGPGCEPGIAEAMRVLRPGGALVVVDLDATEAPYGRWMCADLPHYDARRAERFFADAGFGLRRVDTKWVFPDRAALRAVLGIEFGPVVAERAFAETAGVVLDVRYRVHTLVKPFGLTPAAAWRPS